MEQVVVQPTFRAKHIRPHPMLGFVKQPARQLKISQFKKQVTLPLTLSGQLSCRSEANAFWVIATAPIPTTPMQIFSNSSRASTTLTDLDDLNPTLPIFITN
ncbi:hypothetical protein GOBAR_AA37220 [Gossypium barbadense]|uniref:Uncharacterized protein n=1 Tax=Gossypium barbadense TaxID=3634 RepID=A0A2P5VXC8_GOSBA|nr:hypothetical protein GOBAR_AA37220 [Gossypium barbadense]